MRDAFAQVVRGVRVLEVERPLLVLPVHHLVERLALAVRAADVVVSRRLPTRLLAPDALRAPRARPNPLAVVQPEEAVGHLVLVDRLAADPTVADARSRRLLRDGRGAGLQQGDAPAPAVHGIRWKRWPREQLLHTRYNCNTL